MNEEFSHRMPPSSLLTSVFTCLPSRFNSSYAIFLILLCKYEILVLSEKSINMYNSKILKIQLLCKKYAWYSTDKNVV